MSKTSIPSFPQENTSSNETLWQPERFGPVYFDDLKQLFDVHKCENWPSPKWLTQQLPPLNTDLDISFAANEVFEDDTRYYEQIIFEDNCVPTRTENWHDLFNGLSWSLFPRTKQLLNRQHMADIGQYGLNPRTKRRNRITHFDECGVILAVANPLITDQLAEHQWMEAFYENRLLWGRKVRAFIFGHANYEMLLSPFLGLTAKWVDIQVRSGFFDEPLNKQYEQLDGELSWKVANGLFMQHKGLKPLPLLGIPEWHKENCHSGFYHNTDYFRPKRVCK